VPDATKFSMPSAVSMGPMCGCSVRLPAVQQRRSLISICSLMFLRARRCVAHVLDQAIPLSTMAGVVSVIFSWRSPEWMTGPVTSKNSGCENGCRILRRNEVTDWDVRLKPCGLLVGCCWSGCWRRRRRAGHQLLQPTATPHRPEWSTTSQQTVTNLTAGHIWWEPISGRQSCRRRTFQRRTFGATLDLANLNGAWLWRANLSGQTCWRLGSAKRRCRTGQSTTRTAEPNWGSWERPGEICRGKAIWKGCVTPA